MTATRKENAINLPWWLKLSKSIFNSSLSKSLSCRLGDPPPFIDLKYWLQRVRPASFFSRFSFARLTGKLRNKRIKKPRSMRALRRKNSRTYFETTPERLACPVLCPGTVARAHAWPALDYYCKQSLMSLIAWPLSLYVAAYLADHRPANRQCINLSKRKYFKSLE